MPRTQLTNRDARLAAEVMKERRALRKEFEQEVKVVPTRFERLSPLDRELRRDLYTILFSLGALGANHNVNHPARTAWEIAGKAIVRLEEGARHV